MGAPNPRVQCYATPRDVTRNGTNQAYSRPIIRTSDQKSVATRRPARGALSDPSERTPTCSPTSQSTPIHAQLRRHLRAGSVRSPVHQRTVSKLRQAVQLGAPPASRVVSFGCQRW